MIVSFFFFFFSSRRRHTRCSRDWSSDVCSSDLTLMVPLYELERAYELAKTDPSFQADFQSLLKNFAGRPTPLQFASRLTAKLGGPRIYLKREDLLHTGAHKINNAIGQGLLAV